jgi:hypothetical protein
VEDRKTLLALLVAVVLLEALLLWRGGIIGWFVSGRHTPDEVRELVFDWRVLLSVALVSLILWLAYRWLRLGPGRPDDDTPTDQDSPRRHRYSNEAPMPSGPQGPSSRTDPGSKNRSHLLGYTSPTD